MKVQTLDESVVREIGHAFGYYDDGKEPGFVSAFSSRDAAAEARRASQAKSNFLSRMPHDIRTPSTPSCV